MRMFILLLSWPVLANLNSGMLQSPASETEDEYWQGLYSPQFLKCAINAH